MKLPKTLRRLTWVFLAAFVVSCLAIPVTESFLHDLNPDPAHLPLPVLVLLALMGVFFLLMIGSLLGSVLIRSAENAGLRNFGQSATAKVLAVHETGERDNYRPVVRIKLEVHPPNSAPFEAVAEDALASPQLWNISPGATVAVRYDPRTKEVALEKSKKSKEDDF